MECTHKMYEPNERTKKIIEIQRESIHQLMFAFPPFFRRTKFSVIAADVVLIAVAAFFSLSFYSVWLCPFFFLLFYPVWAPLNIPGNCWRLQFEVDLFLFAVIVFSCVCCRLASRGECWFVCVQFSRSVYAVRPFGSLLFIDSILMWAISCYAHT